MMQCDIYQNAMIEVIRLIIYVALTLLKLFSSFEHNNTSSCMFSPQHGKHACSIWLET